MESNVTELLVVQQGALGIPGGRYLLIRKQEAPGQVVFERTNCFYLNLG